MDEREELARLREALDAVTTLDLEGPAAERAVAELERIVEALTALLGEDALGGGTGSGPSGEATPASEDAGHARPS